MGKVEIILATTAYKSAYQPGIGVIAISLDKEIHEESLAKEQDGDSSDDDVNDDD